MPLPSLPPGSRQLATAGGGVDAVRSSAIKPDDYQRAIIECPDKVIVANAFAGSGKTTMAQMYAQARPRSNILYLCFGKANQLVAKARFGVNVDCRTGHSLAYEAIGYRFKERNQYFIKPQDFARQLSLTDTRKAAVLLDILGKWCASNSVTISAVHLEEVGIKWGFDEREYGVYIAQAKMAWSKITSPGSTVTVLPDFYMKMWALTHPKLSRYTIIIVDEGQDTAPVLSQIIEDQTHATRLLIGDQHQSIFQFRGAINAMETFSALGATVLKMPKTWRFGQDIADKANKLLSLFKGETTAIIGAGPASARRPETKRAVLARTNAGLIAEAAAVYGRQTHWIGGIKNYKVDVLVDAFNLSTDQHSSIRDPYMRGFRSWSHYKDEAIKMRDGQAQLLIMLVGRYAKDIPTMVRSFHTNALETEAGAKLVLSTMHKAKGLDFDHVTVCEDFHGLEKALSSLIATPTEPLDKDHVQEINGLYVAMTRARHQLDLNKESKDFFTNYDRHVSAVCEARARARALQSSSTPVSLDTAPEEHAGADTDTFDTFNSASMEQAPLFGG